MGKQRIPQAQRPGRRPPVRRGPGEIAGAAAMPAEAVAEVGADLDPTAPDQDVAPVGAEIEAETPEAATASTESPPVETPAEATGSDASEAPTAEVAAVPELEAVAALDAPEEAAAEAHEETVAEAAAPDEPVFAQVLDRYCDGARDPLTREALDRG